MVRKITELFRDQQGLRESRDRARMKHLFLREGWTAETFLADLNRRLGYQLDPAVEEKVPDDIYRDHVGIHRQKQEGLSLRGPFCAPWAHDGCPVGRGGRFGPKLWQWPAAHHGHAEPGRGQRAFSQGARVGPGAGGAWLAGRGLQSFWRGAIACTGSEFCKLAITETKGFTRWIVDELEERLPGFDQQLKLHVTGCPN